MSCTIIIRTSSKVAIKHALPRHHLERNEINSHEKTSLSLSRRWEKESALPTLAIPRVVVT